jgi:hypothetical protein
MLGLEPTVTVVNRLIDDDGNHVPYEFVFDAIPGQVIDQMVMPVGPARIIVHNSMYSTGPNGNEYRLGVKEWGLPTDPIPPDDLHRDELIDRAALGYPRQTIKGNKLGKGAPLKQPARVDPISTNNPRGGDGAFPGYYGESKS